MPSSLKKRRSEPRVLKATQPSDICLTLATVAEGETWLSADEIRFRLRMLGFEGFTAQQIASWLRRLERMDAPPITSREVPWGGNYREYSVTMYGRTWLSNKLEWTRRWR